MWRGTDRHTDGRGQYTWHGNRPQPRQLCVRWGPSTPRKKEHTHNHPIFGPCLSWPNGWMDEDAAWYGSRHCLRPHCTRWGPSSRERQPPLFGPCLLWPRSPISATAELLYWWLLADGFMIIHVHSTLQQTPPPPLCIWLTALQNIWLAASTQSHANDWLRLHTKWLAVAAWRRRRRFLSASCPVIFCYLVRAAASTRVLLE